MKHVTYAIFILSVFSASAPQAWAQAGGSGGNGGGIAEMRFTLAFDHAFKLFSYCLNLGKCNLTPAEMDLTRSLLRIEKTERAALSNFHFVAKDPAFFTIDGQVRIAKTDLTPGSIIYGNLDLMYRKNALGETEAITYQEAVQIVVHELGHHTGVKDHNALDVFGAKYAAIAKRLGYSSALGFGADDVRFMVMNTQDNHFQIEIRDNPDLAYSAISVEDRDDGYEVGKLVTDAILKREGVCLQPDPNDTAKCLVTFAADDVIQSIQFYNLHWGDVPMPLFDGKIKTIQLQGFASVLGWKKKMPGGFLDYISAYMSFTIEFDVREIHMNELNILKDSFKLRSLVTTAGGISRF